MLAYLDDVLCTTTLYDLYDFSYNRNCQNTLEIGVYVVQCTQ